MGFWDGFKLLAFSNSSVGNCGLWSAGFFSILGNRGSSNWLFVDISSVD